MLDRLMDDLISWTKENDAPDVIDQTDDWHQIPSINTNLSLFCSTVHVTYNRDLEAHYRVLLNITAQFRGKLLQHLTPFE